MSDRAVFLNSIGARCTVHISGGDHVASQHGSTLSAGSWNGNASTLIFRKNFRWWPSTALVAGVTYSYAGPVLRRLCILLVGQSNAEGRGTTADAPAVVNADRILRNTYPIDENHSGPGAPSFVGPGLLLADKILSAGYYDRVFIVSTATGTQSIADLYGTNGNDGTYATQRNHADVGAGVEGSNPGPYIQPDDDVLIVYCQGESDAGASPPADWSADVQTLLNHIMTNDYPSSNFIGIIISRFGPAAPDDLIPSVSHPSWDVIRAEQLELEDLVGSPIQLVIDYQDDDRISGDEAHIATGTDETFGWRRWTTEAVNRAIEVGILV